jgi:molecular chaperone HtpG
MAKKQFGADTKKLMDLMINSIYTNKEIFLRELISNASDAIDKLYYMSLTDTSIKVDKEDLEIRVDIDKDKRTITISDNGCGMTKEELETNLGTIAKSGSLAFKEENEHKKDIDIIGQFGVGFYSAFMVSSSVEVLSRAYGSDDAYTWTSNGIDGYEIKKSKKDNYGTIITLTIKEDTDNENYSELLESYKIQGIIRKYSDYITYPIKMEVTHSHLKEGTEDEYEDIKEIETINSMIPLWKKNKKDIKEEEYTNFYNEKFFDYDKPADVIHTSVEGKCSYNALMFIPSHPPYDFYTKEYEKGLALYSNGVLIMDKCSELLPDYFSFVKGLVDTQDLSLNISRELLQQDTGLKLIAKSIQGKIKKELENLLKNDREKYTAIFNTFGRQLKFGVYDNYGMNKDELKDLLMFYSSSEKKLVTLAEYVSRMKEGQDSIYYASGESAEKIDMLPQVEQVKEKDYEILYLTDYVDEFVMQVLTSYNDKKLVNVSDSKLDLTSEEEKEEIKTINEEYKDMFSVMKETLSDSVNDIRFTKRLKNHPVCLISEGDISIEMEKVINAMPTDQEVHAKMIMEINEQHPIASKIKDLYNTDKDKLKDYTKVLYAQARLIEGLPVDNPTEISNLICDMLAK